MKLDRGEAVKLVAVCPRMSSEETLKAVENVLGLAPF